MIDLHLTVTDPFSSSTGVRSNRPSEHFSAKTLDQLSSTSKKLVLKQKPIMKQNILKKESSIKKIIKKVTK
jgi:hypothetical protein